MNSSIKTLAIQLMVGVAFAACSSSDDSIIEQPLNPTEPKTYTMTIQASKGDDAATRALSLDGKTLNVKWNEGEMVYVLQQDKDNTAGWYYVGKLTAAASSNATTTLSGTLTLEIGEGGTYLDPDAPALRFVLHGNALGSSNASDYSTGQNGLLTGTGSIEEKYDFASCDVAKGSYTIDTEAKTVSVTGGITLVSEQAIVKFSLYQADGTTPINATSLAITSTGDMKAGRAYDSDATTIITQSVSLTGLEGSTNNLYVALCNYNATAYTLTATDAAGNTYTYGPKTTTFTNGKYYEVKVKMKTHEYVDLGLNVKWATMNVGAESVTDRGLYFAWGETTGHAFGSGYDFSEGNYAWYNSTDKYTKYKHDGSSWDYEVLESDDDAATRNWGGMWRMPTKAEWEELLNEDNCTWTWTTDYKGSNVAGVIVTSKKVGYTDKSIYPMRSFLSPSRNSSSVIILYSPRLARSTSSSARYNDSFTYAFCRAVLASSAVGSSSFPASHSRSFFFNAIPWIYVQRLFSCIAVIILTFYSLRANLRIIPETTKYKQINHIINKGITNNHQAINRTIHILSTSRTAVIFFCKFYLIRVSEFLARTRAYIKFFTLATVAALQDCLIIR